MVGRLFLQEALPHAGQDGDGRNIEVHLPYLDAARGLEDTIVKVVLVLLLLILS